MKPTAKAIKAAKEEILLELEAQKLKIAQGNKLSNEDRLEQLREIADMAIIWAKQCPLKGEFKGSQAAISLAERSMIVIDQLEKDLTGSKDTSSVMAYEYELPDA